MRRFVLIAGLAFLYLPLVIVAIYSFNASRLVTVWAGVSTRWYGELFADPQILRAAGLSVIVAALSASVATALGTTAGIALARATAQDRSLEEAAADLGARPATVFWRIVLPLLMPAVASGWLLAFVLSFDDLVIASFVTGPQATTLPMVVFSAIRLGV